MQKWVPFYKPSDFLFEANEAAERIDEELKYLELQEKKKCSLSQLIKFLCLEYIPQTHRNYVLFNKKLVCGHPSLSIFVPSYLSEHAQWVVDTVLDKIRIANQCLADSYVEPMEDDQFSVYVENTKETFCVNFDSTNKAVICNCPFFTKRKFICEHSVIVGRFYPNWNLEKISDWLFSDLIFRVDFDCFEDPLYTVTHNIQGSPPRESNEGLDSVNTLKVDEASPNGKTKFPSPVADDCLQYLVALERMTEVMDCSQLNTFKMELVQLHARWSEALRQDNDSFSEELPIPYLRQVSRLFAPVRSLLYIIFF